MSTRDRVVPRKKPRQKRAQATVEVILEAAAHILVSSGYEATTTKEIAERAGVSIGSLYQYFPSKEALVATLVEQLFQRSLRALSDKVGELSSDTDPERLVRELVGTMVEVYSVNPRLLQLLLEQSPRLGRLQSFREVEVRVEQLAQGMLSRTVRFERPEELPLVTFLIVRALRGALWAVVLERPEFVGTPALVEELSQMVLGYLRPRMAPPATGG